MASNHPVIYLQKMQTIVSSKNEHAKKAHLSIATFKNKLKEKNIMFEFECDIGQEGGFRRRKIAI